MDPAPLAPKADYIFMGGSEEIMQELVKAQRKMPSYITD